jgi:glycosyltransferase involved in cell wall biosynthesis
MRIVHFSIGRCNPDSANGVDKAIFYLSKAQAALGNPAAVFALTAKEPIPIPGVVVRGYAPVSSAFGLPRQLLADLAQWQPGVVHLHSIYSPPNTALASWLYRHGFSYVVTPHRGLSSYVSWRRWYLKIPYKYLFELPMLNRAAFVHAVSDENSIRAYGVRAPVVVAPNGIDLASIPSDRPETPFDSLLPQAQGKLVFMFIGRLDPFYKGLDLLLKGFALARLQDSILVLVGPDYRNQGRSLRAMAQRLGIGAQVVFFGPAYGRSKYDLLSGADVFVLCSRSEGMPLSVLEAASCSKPCMVSSSANPAGMVERFRAGIVVQPNVMSIAEGFTRMKQVPETKLGEMGRNARIMVENEFSWGKTAETLVEAYSNYARRENGKDRDS